MRHWLCENRSVSVCRLPKLFIFSPDVGVESRILRFIGVRVMAYEFTFTLDNYSVTCLLRFLESFVLCIYFEIESLLLVMYDRFASLSLPCASIFPFTTPRDLPPFLRKIASSNSTLFKIASFVTTIPRTYLE